MQISGPDEIRTRRSDNEQMSWPGVVRRVVDRFLGWRAGHPKHGLRACIGPQSSAVVAATVVVTNIDTNTSLTLQTNETGYYEARLLLPGRYQVTAEASGFKKSVAQRHCAAHQHAQPGKFSTGTGRRLGDHLGDGRSVGPRNERGVLGPHHR